MMNWGINDFNDALNRLDVLGKTVEYDNYVKLKSKDFDLKYLAKPELYIEGINTDKLILEFNNLFLDVFNFSRKNGLFWDYCSFKVYVNTYEKRFQGLTESFEDADEEYFCLKEIKIIEENFSYNTLTDHFSSIASKLLKKQKRVPIYKSIYLSDLINTEEIKHSQNKKIEFLERKINDIKHHVLIKDKRLIENEDCDKNLTAFKLSKESIEFIWDNFSTKIKSSKKDFERAFSGKKIDGFKKIDWTGTNYELKYFVDSFAKDNGKKFKIASELFTVNGDKITSDQLTNNRNKPKDNNFITTIKNLKVKIGT